MYDGGPLVTNAVNMGKPYIFVAVGYRVGGFGFMGGKEILADGAANAGLLDQRMGLEWVADNIAAFGGDPDKVTIWGESAGAISVFDQMALYDGDNTYKGKPLFRGAIMNSGSLVPADPVDCPKAQVVYDAVVAEAGCAGFQDTLACLRAAPYDKFLAAANSVPGILSYSSVALSYMPRPDGKVLTQSPDLLVKAGKYAAVPMIIGDQEDEGTLFALFQPNVTTSADIVDYLGTLFFTSASKTELEGLVDTYSPWVWDGSPFGTGILNEIYPGFKRLAAILGDLVFTLTRRVFLESAVVANPNVPVWSYLASYDFGTPIMGTFHGSDILQVFYGILPNYASKSIQSYYANFVYNLDPNNAAGGTSSKSKVAENWPRWTNAQRRLVQFFADRTGYLNDDFRDDSAKYIAEHAGNFYV
jgi:carboxylesterase type B